jgi:hypothetical protein
VLFAILGALVVIVLAAVAFLVLRGDDPAEDEVTLVAVTDAGADPWTDNLDTGNDALDRLDIVLGDVPALDGEVDALGITVAGSEAGLFGGVRDTVACDRDELAAQLGDDDKSAAFADVQGIETGELGGFIAALTAVMLRQDVRLADHGFVDGEAERFEAVLEKGTAVLVDADGVPRARCASGSPLVAARATGDAETFRGTQWPGFGENRIVVIDGADVGEAFVLIDNDTEDVFNRPVGSAGDDDTDADPDVACGLNPDSATCLGGTEPEPEPGPDDSTTTTEPVLGTGDVQFTLRWDSSSDLDLAVTDPTGALIDFQNPTSPSGGSLDVDANASCREEDTPVENIFWPSGTAPAGTFTVEVRMYDDCDNGPQEFELRALIGGQTLTEADTLGADSETRTFTFTL